MQVAAALAVSYLLTGVFPPGPVWEEDLVFELQDLQDFSLQCLNY